MTQTRKNTPPAAGDVITIDGHRVGRRGRMGEILEVIGERGHEHFRVRWDDGRESIFYPSSDSIVRPRHSHRAAAR